MHPRIHLCVMHCVDTRQYYCVPVYAFLYLILRLVLQISRHSSFQESRCFYVVLKDGRREDFSYRKCLDNLVKKKYPDVAESFISKYFWKPRPRGDQAGTPGLTEQASTPGLTEQAPTPGLTEQAPTPGLPETNE